MRRKKNSEWNLIEFPVIEAAEGGNTEALNGILKHYEAYISFLSIRCSLRSSTDGFAEQNGRDAERADLLY